MAVRTTKTPEKGSKTGVSRPKRAEDADAKTAKTARSTSPWANAPATPGRSRRTDEEGSKRSFGGLGRRKTVSAYEAAADHPLVPRVWDPSPNSTAIQQRFMQILARHLVRNDSFVANLVRVMVDTHVGLGSRPVSRFEERDEAFMRISRHFDHDGDRSFGAFQRDVYTAKVVDGEVFVRRIDHSRTALGRSIPIPVTWQILRSEYVPHDFTRMVEGFGQFVNGICRVDGRVAWYAVYNRHPRESIGVERLVVQYVPAAEIYHLRDTAGGGNRGEVMLASALLRAIKASTLEDSELRRKHLASLMSIAVYRPADDYDDFKLPSEAEVSDMIDAAVLSPGGFIEMPYGYKAELLSPPDEGSNFERALRWQMMGVCASVGAPVHEVLGDWANLPERMARYMGQTQQRRADIVREDGDHQVWEPMYVDASDYMMAQGIWLPPETMSLADLYQHYWDHPPLPMASFKQELAILLLAEKQGVIDVGYIQKTLFGLTGTEVSRRRAAGFAQDHALGLVQDKPRWDPAASDATQRLLDAALEEEIAELDLIDQSELDTGSMQSPP